MVTVLLKVRRNPCPAQPRRHRRTFVPPATGTSAYQRKLAKVRREADGNKRVEADNYVERGTGGKLRAAAKGEAERAGRGAAVGRTAADAAGDGVWESGTGLEGRSKPSARERGISRYGARRTAEPAVLALRRRIARALEV